MYQSEAFLSLGKNARMIVIALLDARIRNPLFSKDVKAGKRKKSRQPRFKDLDKIEMPYMTLQKKYKIPQQSIPRAIDQLLAHGFIRITHAGGRGEHDKAQYGLIDDYLKWEPGKVFRVRKRDAKRGFQRQTGRRHKTKLALKK